MRGGHCCCSQCHGWVWNQLCLPSEPRIFPGGLRASYGTFDFSKRTRVLILTSVPGAPPGCFPFPSLQLRISPMSAQAPHLCSYFLAKLGLQGRAVSRSYCGTWVFLHPSGQGAGLPLLPAREGPGLVSGHAGVSCCPFSASATDTLACVPSVLRKPKACLLQCRPTCFFYKCLGITIDFFGAEDFEILSLGLVRFPCCSNNALSFLIYPVSDTIVISNF